MKKQLILFVILGIALILALCYGLWITVHEIWSVIKVANPTVLSATIGAACTIIISILSVFIGRYLERKKIIEMEIRNKKNPIYEEFIQKTLTFVLQKEEDQDIEELKPYFNEFSQKLIVWGNQRVIKKWVEFRIESKSMNRPILVIYEELMFEIRRDIGQNNSELKFGDLMSVFINDYHQFIQKTGYKINI